MSTDRMAGLSREEKARLFEKLRARGGAARPDASGAPASGEPPVEPIEPLPPDFGPPPLSFSQGRLWLVDRMNPGDSTYHISTPLRIRGRFVPAAMAAALSGVVARHEALRTTFPNTDSGPVQRIAPPAPVPLPRIDLAACPEAAREAELVRIVVAEAARPFSLARGPLLRALLVALASEDQALLFNLHHIISDGWSSSILVAEATALYAAAVEGRAPSGLAPLPIQYADFAVWQRRYLSGAELARQLAYWRGALAGAFPELSLPHDFERPGAPSGSGRSLPFELSPATCSAIRELARAEGSTPYMVLLAAWGLFLAGVAQVDDVVIGTSIANRNRAETAGLIGLFANLLPLRLALGGAGGPGDRGPSFRELVRRARRTALGAFAHQDLPFERLVEEIKSPRRLGATPVFQVLFVFINTPQPTFESADLSFSPIDLPTVMAKFDLSLGFIDQGGRYSASFDYATDVFSDATAASWLSELKELIEVTVAAPDRPIWDLSERGGFAPGTRLPIVDARARSAEEAPPFVPPTLPVERQVARIWSEVLGVDLPRIGRHSNFFDLGGHSLLAVQLALEIERAFKVEISLRALFENPSLAAFSEGLAEVERAAGAASSAAVSERAIPRLAVRPDPLPLSFAQSRLWLIDRLEKGSATEPAYHIPAPLRVRGRFAPAALASALSAVVARHETLRTTFEATEEGPVQRVGPAAPVALPLLDLSAIGSPGAERELARCFAAEAARPFSLERGPVLRAAAVQLGAEDHALLLTLHHIVSDGWSSSILIGEAAALYEAAATGRPAALAPLPIQYADFAVWQRAFLEGPELDRQLAYWRSALLGAPFELPLPLDHPRPPARGSRGGACNFTLPGATAEPLRSLALAEGATPFMVLLAAWGLFLGRMAGVSDLVLGTPIANRNRTETAGLIGFFVNSLAIRLRLDRLDLPEEPTFRDLLRRVRRSMLDAFAHQDLPFERLVEDLNPPRDSGLSPIFQVLTAYQSVPSARLEAAGLLFEPVELPSRIAKFDLSLLWAEKNGEIVGGLEYALDLFAEETMGRWVETFSGLLARLLAAPDEPAERVAGLLVERPVRQPPVAAVHREREAQSFEPPATPLEKSAARLWADLLGVEPARIGRHSSFFELGGHSLSAAQLTTRVERALGVEIPLRALFERPTLAAFAEDLEAAGARPDAPGAGEPAAGAAPAPPDVSRAPSGRAIPRLAVRPDPLPLSFAQSRLWVLDRLGEGEGGEAAGNPAYHIPTALRIRGRFAPAAMKAALGAMVARHEALRTTFETTEQGPVQRISPAGPVALPAIDLSALPDRPREAELLRILLAESVRPFSLRRGPLLRSLALRLGAEDQALLLNLHHIVSDGWSSSILVAESAALYAAAALGRPAGLPPLPIQYADFSVWQRAFLSGPELHRQLAFWRESLAGAPPELPLRLDHPRPRTPTGRGGQAGFELAPAAAEAVRSLARAERATPFMILLAAWSWFLGRYAGVSDLVVGTAIANRNRAEITGLIGFFVNTLAIRMRLGRREGEGEPSFRELIRRARRGALEAFAHQDLPFERLVEELQPDRNLGVSPIFQTLFSFLNTPEPKLRAAGLSFEQIDLPFAPSKFDLSLGLADRDGRIAGSVEYSLDLFERETVERWSQSLAGWVGRAAADPDRPARELSTLDETERRQLLIGWNPGADPAEGEADPSLSTLPAMFRRQAAATPEALAVRRGAEALTFRELDLRSDRLARRLVARGARPEEAVGACLDREVGLIVALLAVLKSGAAYLPLDPAYPPERLAFMLGDARCRLLIGDSDRLGRLAAGLAAREAELPGGLAAFAALTVVSPDDSPVSEPAASEDGLPLPEPHAASFAYAIYTSGSTGRPKGVAIEHAQAAAMLRWARGAFGAEERAGLLAATSVCFDLSVFEIFLPLVAGGTVLLAENALELPQVAAWGDVRLVNTVPSAMAELVRKEAIPPGVRTVCLAGEALPGELVAGIFRTSSVERVLNLYGPSEDTTYSTVAEFRRAGGDPEEGARQAAPPIGRPIAGGRAYLLDPPAEESGHGLGFELVPAGAVGELYLGGRGIARGYLGRPDLTAERFLPDPFGAVPGARLYKTGDLARYRTVGREPGELLFLGRRDHQVKVRGFRVELGEIESALRADRRVADAVVVPNVEEGGGVGRLAAYVVPAPGEPLSVSDLRQLLGGRLPEAFQPSFWVLLDALPRSPNGKIDRRALPDPTVAGATEEPPQPPEGALEKLSARIWSEVLGLDVERIGRKSSFFSLGGHSLLGAQVATRTERMLQVPLPLRALFEHPTLEGFAAQIALSDPQPGRAEKIARAVLRVQAMTGGQKEAMRREGEPVGV